MEGWGGEGARSFGPNVVSFIIMSGRKCWYGVGAYVTPNDLPTVHWITQALACGPKEMGNVLVGNLNAFLENLREQRE